MRNVISSMFLLALIASCNNTKQDIKRVQTDIEKVTLKSDSINKKLHEMSKELDHISKDTIDYKFP